MKPATTNLNTLNTLRLLYELARHDYPAHLGALAGHLRLARTEVADCLLALERAGLVRADRVRLTMAGLVVASRLPALDVRPPRLAERTGTRSTASRREGRRINRRIAGRWQPTTERRTPSSSPRQPTPGSTWSAAARATP